MWPDKKLEKKLLHKKYLILFVNMYFNKKIIYVFNVFILIDRYHT